MRIAADGTWFHEGSPIGRAPLVRLFASVLRRDADGAHRLVTPAENGVVEVEDSAFVAVEARREGGSLRLRTNIGDWVEVGPAHPLRLAVDAGGEPRPYVSLWRGLEARLLRSVFYHLAAEVEPGEWRGERRMGVRSGGAFFPLDAAHGSPAFESPEARARRGPPRGPPAGE